MASTRARTLAAVLGILALAAIAGSLGHPVVIERWHLRRLDSEDEAVRRAAADALGKRRSVRAIPRLFGLLTVSESDQVEGQRLGKIYVDLAARIERRLPRRVLRRLYPEGFPPTETDGSLFRPGDRMRETWRPR